MSGLSLLIVACVLAGEARAHSTTTAEISVLETTQASAAGSVAQTTPLVNMWVALKPGVFLKKNQTDPSTSLRASVLPVMYRVIQDAPVAGTDYRFLLQGDVQGWARLADLQEPTETLEGLKRLIDRSPLDPRLLNARGLFETQVTGFLPSALADFDEALRLDPSFAPAYYNRAFANMSNQNNDRAYGDLFEAIRLDRGNPDFHLLRAQVATTLSQRQGITPAEKRILERRANADYATVLRLRPTDQTATRALSPAQARPTASSPAPKLSKERSDRGLPETVKPAK